MDSIPEETWKEIPSCELHQVRSLGKVRSKPHEGFAKGRKTTRLFPGKTLTPQKSNKGYLHVTIKGVTRDVHKMVAIAFLGSHSGRQSQVNHKDGDKTNNAVSNLEVVTSKENIAHAERTGLRRSAGEGNSNSKLTQNQVMEIRSRKERSSVIAREFGVTLSLIVQIRNRRAWKHIA